MVELIILSTEETDDKDFQRRLEALCLKIIKAEDSIKSNCGICITYCDKHKKIGTLVQQFSRTNGTGFKRLNKITPHNFTVGKYCIDYTGEKVIRKMLKTCEVKTHRPRT